jgi:hypothetical protein
VVEDEPTILSAMTDAETEWKLPVVSKPQDMSALSQKLRSKPLWGKDETPEVDKKTEAKKTWRLVGIIEEPAAKFALIAHNDGKVQRYAPAATLPDTSVLRIIAHDLIKIQREETLETVYLYPRVTTQ